MLDRARPLSRFETFNGTIALVSAADGSPFPSEDVSFTYSIYPADEECGCGHHARPLAQVASGTDNLVAFENVVAFAFPDGTLEQLGPGRYVRILLCTLDGATSELQRAPLTVI